MPLRVVRRPGRDLLYVRGTVRGQGCFESTGTSDPEKAEAYRAKREAELWDRSVYGAKAVVSFAAALESYLRAAERPDSTKALASRLLDHFGTTPLARIDQEAVDRAYAALLTPRAGPATRLRAVLTPLRAVLTHAARRGWCALPAFETPRVPRQRTQVLLPDQASALVRAAAPHLRPLLVFLLCTGARMSEALELEWAAVDLRGARATLRQKQGTERHADLQPAALAALAALPHRDGRVFRPARHNGRALGEAYRDTGRAGGGQIKTGWATACGRAGLPGRWVERPRPDRPGRAATRFSPELRPHDLRHTWASWHFAVHKDMLKLRDDGGWETIRMVERYSKRIGEGHREAILAFWGAAPSAAAERSA